MLRTTYGVRQVYEFQGMRPDLTPASPMQGELKRRRARLAYADYYRSAHCSLNHPDIFHAARIPVQSQMVHCLALPWGEGLFVVSTDVMLLAKFGASMMKHSMPICKFELHIGGAECAAVFSFDHPCATYKPPSGCPGCSGSLGAVDNGNQLGSLHQHEQL